MKKTPMTVKGAELLRAELENLVRVERRNIIAAIAEARAHGDLRENAEYHAAKEKQSFIEGRIADLEGKLSLAEIIDVTKLENNGVVVFGATVQLLNLDTEETITYRIVGVDEANIKEGRLSVSAPIARAIIGKNAGDVVEVQTPAGPAEYEILAVEYI